MIFFRYPTHLIEGCLACQLEEEEEEEGEEIMSCRLILQT